MTTLRHELGAYGADGGRVLELSAQGSSDTVRYVDLVRLTDHRPDAVVEDATGAPIAYVVDGRHRQADDITTWTRQLALRGDAHYLAVVRPGLLEVHAISLERASGTRGPIRTARRGTREAETVFPTLLMQPPSFDKGPAIHHVVFRLMKQAIDALMGHRDQQLRPLLDRSDALALVGRAVFLRFLLDRDLLPESEWKAIDPDLQSPERAVDNAASTAAVCRWLDHTFNGDFLPLSFDYCGLDERVSNEGFRALGNILRRAPAGQLHLADADGKGLDGWEDLDFGRIPVGVLSQVYEQQAMDWAPDAAKNQSAHYTPATIAGFMTEEVFASLDTTLDPPAYLAKVLDPAVGGGVFLVAAFRALLARRWRATGQQPGTAEIREVLYGQLTGFDVEATALQLTALSLYLAAIEQDPAPQPLQKLRFDQPLLGTVLHNVGEGEVAGRAGSLGSNVSPKHRGRYDVVIGNPPWTAGKIEPGIKAEVLAHVRPIVKERLGDAEAKDFSIPDDNKDLAFLWRCLDWGRPGARIALIVHARLLFKQSDPGCKARDQLLRAFQWTGVLNGAALRQTSVWPGVSAPFAALFGLNVLGDVGVPVYVYSPMLEKALNDDGRLRIDAEAAEPIDVSLLAKMPWLMKALFRGTRLDVALLEKVRRKGTPLAEYWDTLGLARGQGYKVARTSSVQNARFLLDSPDITPHAISGPLGRSPNLPLASFQRFGHTEVHRPRKEEIYRTPLVLIREAASPASRALSVYLAESTAMTVAYSQSFCGFSAEAHEAGSELARYLLVVLASPLLRWFVLMTSSKYGIERDVQLVEDVNRLPLVPFDDLSEELRADLARVADAYLASGKVGPDHDTFIQRIYGLDTIDWQVILDTLAFNGPDTRAATNAQRPSTEKERRQLVRTLGAALATTVREVDVPSQSPWRVLQIGGSPDHTPGDLSELLKIADNHAATRCIVSSQDGAVTLVAILDQARYWTASRTRLLALDLVRRMPS